MKQTLTRRLFSQDSGAQIAEFAAVVPMLLMMIFGILWFGRAFNIYTTVNHAARAAAEAAAIRTCASCGNGFPTDAILRSNVVDPILTASSLDPAQVQTFTVVHDVDMNPTSGSNVRGVVVTMTYPYNFKLNGLSCCPPALTPVSLGVVINGRAESKEEN